jgi:hypothetical protein
VKKISKSSHVFYLRVLEQDSRGLILLIILQAVKTDSFIHSTSRTIHARTADIVFLIERSGLNIATSRMVLYSLLLAIGHYYFFFMSFAVMHACIGIFWNCPESSFVDA